MRIYAQAHSINHHVCSWRAELGYDIMDDLPRNPEEADDIDQTYRNPEQNYVDPQDDEDDFELIEGPDAL